MEMTLVMALIVIAVVFVVASSMSGMIDMKSNKAKKLWYLMLVVAAAIAVAIGIMLTHTGKIPKNVVNEKIPVKVKM